MTSVVTDVCRELQKMSRIGANCFQGRGGSHRSGNTASLRGWNPREEGEYSPNGEALDVVGGTDGTGAGDSVVRLAVQENKLDLL